MKIAESMLPEFDQEMAGRAKVLERIPTTSWNGEAHPKSNSIGWVASHLVEIPQLVEGHVDQRSLRTFSRRASSRIARRC